jgi:general secretion pathway protein A
MYNSFFHLRESPFNNTPDPRYLYLSPSHKEALDHLLYGIQERKGFIAVTGGIGMGKTTLCRALLGRLDRSTRTSLIFNSFVSDMELLQTVNQEFGILPRPQPCEEVRRGRERRPGRETPWGKESKKRYIDALNLFLMDNFRSGGNAVLIIDEAQNLPPDALEQIRMLSNLETEREKLIQIILVGQSELKGLLAAPSLKQLNQRITVRYDLKPLDPQGTRGYIAHRLALAGANGSLTFTSGAFARVHRYSQGVPRRINSICDRALLLAYASERHTVSRKMIDRAEEELRGDLAIGRPAAGRPNLGMALRCFLLAALVAAVAFGGWRYRGDFHRLQSLAWAPFSSGEKTPLRAEPDEAPEEDLLLDDKNSIAALFDLYRSAAGDSNPAPSLALFSFRLRPEYYVMIRKCFRASLSSDSPEGYGPRRFLVIRRTLEEGAFVASEKDGERFLPRSIILDRWGGNIDLIFPYDQSVVSLRKGMSGPEVAELQKGLQRLGYLVGTTGDYDSDTSDQVRKFQRDFGLEPDGVAGLKTRALLYGMTDP